MTEKDRNRAVPAVYLILRRESEILLTRRKGSYYDGWYTVPAGHVEAGELPTEALIRESHEEVGIKVNPKNARLVHTMYRTKHDETGDRIDLFYRVERWSGEIINGEPEKCDDIRWFRVDELPEKLMHHVGQAIIDIENNVHSSELSLSNILPNPTIRN